MALPAINEVVKDPEFLSLPAEEKRKVLGQIDPEFLSLPDNEQVKVVESFGSEPEAIPQIPEEDLSRSIPFQGAIIDPRTGLPSEGQIEGLRQQALTEARSRGEGLQKEIAKAEEISQTPAIESAVLGAMSLPVAGATILESLSRNDPNQLRMLSEMSERAAVNPVSTTAGSIATQLPMMGHPGAAVQILKQQGLKAALKSAAPVAGANVAIGEGVRTLTGEETTPEAVALDIVMSAMGGRRPSVRPVDVIEETAEQAVSKDDLANIIRRVGAGEMEPGTLRNRPVSEIPVVQGQKGFQEVPIGGQPSPVGEAVSAMAEGPRQTGVEEVARQVGGVAEEFNPVVEPTTFRQAFKENLSKARRGVTEMFSEDPAVNMRKSVKLKEKTDIPDKELNDQVIPDLFESAKKRQIPLDELPQGYEAATGAMQDKWAKIDALMDEATKKGVEVRIPGVKKTVNDKIFTDSFIEELGNVPGSEGITKEIEGTLAAYADRVMTPMQAEDALQRQNAYLETYYAAFGRADRSLTVEQLAKKNPVAATRLAIAQELRQQIDKSLSKVPGELSQLKKEWANLRKLRAQVQKQTAVAGRQQEFGIDRLEMAKSIGRSMIRLDPLEAASGLAQIAGAKSLKDLESSNEMFRRSISNYAKKRKRQP